MQKPWRPYDAFEFEPVADDAEFPFPIDRLLSDSIDFTALGFERVGDFSVLKGRQRVARYFRSRDGAVLGWTGADESQERDVGFSTLLTDGTLVRAVPARSVPPWNCCRFPVHFVFGDGCNLEELLVLHLKALGELEPACGAALKYPASQLREVVLYMRLLEHETLYPCGAPADPLPVPQPKPAHTTTVRHLPSADNTSVPAGV